jgi:hypothetical protein
VLEAERCLIEERRVAKKASLGLGLNAAPCVKGDLKASGRPVFTKPRVRRNPRTLETENSPRVPRFAVPISERRLKHDQKCSFKRRNFPRRAALLIRFLVNPWSQEANTQRSNSAVKARGLFDETYMLSSS